MENTARRAAKARACVKAFARCSLCRENLRYTQEVSTSKFTLVKKKVVKDILAGLNIYLASAGMYA